MISMASMILMGSAPTSVFMLAHSNVDLDLALLANVLKFIAGAAPPHIYIAYLLQNLRTLRSCAKANT
jgi:hypothetical protein